MYVCVGWGWGQGEGSLSDTIISTGTKLEISYKNSRLCMYMIFYLYSKIVTILILQRYTCEARKKAIKSKPIFLVNLTWSTFPEGSIELIERYFMPLSTSFRSYHIFMYFWISSVPG